MAWDIGAIEYTTGTPIPPIPIPPTPIPSPGIKVRVIGKEKTVKISKRKTNTSTVVLMTVNRDTVVIIE